MFYALQIDVIVDDQRLAKMSGALKQHAVLQIRPHMLYGSTELRTNRAPLLLPRLQAMQFAQYDPRKGALTFESDISTISALTDALTPKLQNQKAGWHGPLDASGRPAGVGVLVFDSGSVYEGEMKDGKCHGKGKMRLASGGVYEGGIHNFPPTTVDRFNIDRLCGGESQRTRSISFAKWNRVYRCIFEQ